MTGFWLFFTDSGIFAYFCADAPCGFGGGRSPAMWVSLPLSVVPHAMKNSLMESRESSASTHAPMPMPMPIGMGMRADASTSMSMSMPTMSVPVVSASVPMCASVPVHAYSYSYAYCRGCAYVLSAIGLYGLYARPIASAPMPMHAAITMTMIMIAPVPAYGTAVDCFVVAGRSLPADAFHDASAHGSAPASMFMFMFMLMLMLAASAALASAPMVMGMSMPMRTVIACFALFPSSAHAPHPLLSAAPRGGASSPLPLAHHGRGRLMGGVREPERRAEGIIRR